MLQKIFQFIKEEWKYLLFLAIMALFMLLPLPYYVTFGGGITKIDKQIVLEDQYGSTGDFYLAYVKEGKATPFTFLLGKIIPSFTVSKSEDVMYENETDADYETRNALYLYSSEQNAIWTAYQYAKADIKIIKQENYIFYVDADAQTDLKVGDIVTTVNGTALEDFEAFRAIVQNSNVGDKIIMTVIRGTKTIECYAYVRDVEGDKLTGVAIFVKQTYETNPTVTVDFKNGVGGPSGGLMLTLAIYDRLVEEDITQGRRIAGTGVITSEGLVSPIGGVEDKLSGAVRQKADIFIAPSGQNYEDAVKLANEKHYDIRIIEAKTFAQVLEELQA